MSAISRDGFHLNSSTLQELPWKTKPILVHPIMSPDVKTEIPSTPRVCFISCGTPPPPLFGVNDCVFPWMWKQFARLFCTERNGERWREVASVWLQQRAYEPAVAPVQASLSGSTTLLYIFSVYSFWSSVITASLFSGPSVEGDHLPPTCKEISEEQVFLNTHTHTHLLFIDLHMRIQKELWEVVVRLVNVQSIDTVLWLATKSTCPVLNYYRKRPFHTV